MSGKRPSKKLLLKNDTLAFVYRWIEKSTGKWYIGSRSKVGCHPDDGYICSSELVYLLIESNPANWEREILLASRDVNEVRLEEKRLLTELNARCDPMSYNKTNAESTFMFSTKGKVGITDGLNEKFVSEDDLDDWLRLGWYKGRSKANTDRISKTMMKVREENKEWASVKGEKNNLAKRYLFISPDGHEYFVHGQLSSFCEQHNLSQATLEKSMKQGWIARRGKNAGWKIKDLDTGRETFRDTKNYGESRSGENNPYYDGKKKMLNRKSKDIT